MRNEIRDALNPVLLASDSLFDHRNTLLKRCGDLEDELMNTHELLRLQKKLNVEKARIIESLQRSETAVYSRTPLQGGLTMIWRIDQG